MKKFLSVMLSAALTFSTFSGLALNACAEQPAPATTLQISGMQTDHLTNPVGIDSPAPVFSWYIEDPSVRGQKQTAYRITVSESEAQLDGGSYVWDSGYVESDRTLEIPYAGEALNPSTRYYWQVTVKDKDGISVTSPKAWFETGLMDSGWSGAEWIGKPALRSDAYYDVTSFTIDFDYTIETDAASILFGATGEGDFYMWQISAFDWHPELRLRPHRCVSGGFKELTGANLLPDKSSVGTKQHMTIEVNDGTIKTYLEGELKDTRTYETFELGYVGFRRASPESFSADNIVVKDGDGNILLDVNFDDGNAAGFEQSAVKNGELNFDSDVTGAIFLRQSSGEEIPESAPMLRKEFTLDKSKQVKNARLYITSAGLYKAYINGSEVTDSVLNPGMTAYDDTIMYQTYDVTSLLNAGQNAIGAYLGHGWFNRALRNFGPELYLYAKLLVQYQDGTSETIVTDSSWKYFRYGPILDDDLFNGFKYDATIEKELDGWTEPGYDDSEWEQSASTTPDRIVSNGKTPNIIAQNIPLIRKTVELEALSVSEPKDGVYVYDFGQNIAGVVRVTASAPEGTAMKLRHAEILNMENMIGADDDPGMIFTANLPRAEATDTYVFRGDGGPETFEPFFTYHGFRYLEITGLDEPVPIEDVKALLIMSDLEQTSTFDSSNPLVNRLYLNALWSARDNFMSVPTDCPQRGERFGWTGDAQIFARTGSYLMDVNAFYQKYCLDMRDTSTDNRIIADVSPASAGNGWYGQGDRKGATNGWGDAIVIIPYQMYKQYGNTAILEENYQTMCNWMDYLVSTSTDYIRDESWTGDWLPVNEAKSPIALTDTAFCAYSAKLLSEIAEILGKPEDAAEYEQLYANYRSAWQENFLESDGGTTKCGTQTSYVLGINFGLFDEDKIPLAAENLVKNIKNQGWHLTTGFLGLSYLNPVLSDTGYGDVAYRLLEQEEYPSWLYSVTTGSTTIWESWYAFRLFEDGSSQMTEQSLNHFSYGAVAEWLYRYMLGIERDDSSPESVAFKHFYLKPEFGGSFTYASGSYKSVRGTIESGWTLDKDSGAFTYDALVPANTGATLYLPVLDEGTAVLESGTVAEDSPGVTFVGYENGFNVYNLESGSYSFSTTVDPAYGDVISIKVTDSQGVDASCEVAGTTYTAFPVDLILAAGGTQINAASSDENYTFLHFSDSDGKIYDNGTVINTDANLDMIFAYTGTDDGTDSQKTISLTGPDGVTVNVNGQSHALPYTGTFDKGEIVKITAENLPQAMEFAGLDGISTSKDGVYLMPKCDMSFEVLVAPERYNDGYDIFFDFENNTDLWSAFSAAISHEPGYMRFVAEEKSDGTYDPRASYDFTQSLSTITGGEYVVADDYDKIVIGYIADEVAADSKPFMYISTKEQPDYLKPVRGRGADSSILASFADGETLREVSYTVSDWSAWTGEIKQIYLDIVDNVYGNIRVDYIKLCHRDLRLTVKTSVSDPGTVYTYYPGSTVDLTQLETSEGFLGYSLEPGSEDYITSLVLDKDVTVYANYRKSVLPVMKWDFDDKTAQGWIARDAYSSDTSAQTLKLSYSSKIADVWAYTQDLDVDTSVYRYVVFDMRHNIPDGSFGSKKAEVFFKRTGDGWGQHLSASVDQQSASEEFKTYVVDMSNCGHWNGTVTTLRIDPFETLSPSDGEYWFELDNIRLVPAASLTLFAGYDGGSSDIYTVPAYTEIDLSEYGEPQRSGYTFAGWSNPETGEQVTTVSLDSDTVLSALWTKNASIEWTFADGSYHGWSVVNGVDGGITADGAIKVGFSESNADVWLRNDTLNINADEYKYVVFDMRHNIPDGSFGSKKAEVFFVRTTDTPWQAHLSASVAQRSATEGFDTYIVDMSKCANWNSTVTHLRIDPFEIKNTADTDYFFEISSIRVCAEAMLTLDYGTGKNEYGVPAETEINLSDYQHPESDDMYFMGWSRSVDGEIIDTVCLTEDTTLYAVWSESGAAISLTDENVKVRTEEPAILVVSSYYESGRMCDSIVRPVSQETTFLFENEGLDTKDTSTVRAFLFDSKTGLAPLCASKEVPVIDEYANFVKLIDKETGYSEYMSAEGTTFVFPAVLGETPVKSWTNGENTYECGTAVNAEEIRGTSFCIKNYADLSILENLNVVCIGDSLTQGDYGSIPAGTANVKKEGYPYFFDLFTGANVTNAGRCGYSCELYYNYLPNIESSLTTDTDIVIIMLGTNNGLTDTIDADTASGSPDSYAATQTGYYARIIEHVAEKTDGNAQIILMTPPVTTKRDRTVLETTCSVVKQFGEKYGLKVIDNYNCCGITYDNIATYMPIDELHCGYDGYKMLAAHVALMTAEYYKEFTSTYALNYAELEDEEIGYIGRWYDKTVNGVACKATISQGAEMFFKVEGTSTVALRLHSTAQQAPAVAVSVDGSAPVRMITTLTGDYVIAENLSSEEHYIRVIVDGFYEYQANKWTTGDGFAVEKVVIDNGGKVVGLEPANPVILYYGDSITEGINVLGTGSNPNVNSAIYEFPFVTSHLLGAVSYTNGFGASGVTKGGSGNVPKCLSVIDNVLADTPIDALKNPYAIVINHGHNDGSASANTFITEYKAVLTRLREKYPDTPIFAVVPYFQIHSANIKTAVSEMNDSKVFYISTKGWEYTTSDGVHPDKNGAKKLGTRLAEEMAKILKAEEMRPAKAEITNHTTANLWHEGEVPYHNEDATNYATITPYIVEGSDEAVVIYPGGGYFQLSTVNEGSSIAKAYNDKGISAFVVTYRYQPYNGNAILADGQRAVQYVRYFAKDFGINPDKIAVLGFSAGGHLATMVCQHEPSENLAEDAIGEVSSKPNAVILGYAVTTLGDGTYPTMPGIFLGEENKTNAALIAKYSYSNNLSAMPPAFIFYSTLDTAVNPEKNSVALANAMTEAGKTVEIHGYTDGTHGIGLGTGYTEFSKWFNQSCEFIEKTID